MIFVPVRIQGRAPPPFTYMVKNQRVNRYLERMIKNCSRNCDSCPVNQWCCQLYDYLVDKMDSGTESRKRRKK